MYPIVYKVEADGREAFNLPLSREAFSLAGFGEEIYSASLLKMKWEEVRGMRDKLIAETDWTQMSDTPLTEAQKTAFTTYRQTLRDIPQTYDDPGSVIWPDKPTL
ncbi:tail fiber assembly protein [Vibrio spartinae]|uniref:Phage tail assembly chaperone-like domain-containing protein n=1 Tax=Vibrio spartinae TaxID=1918945 RepID=A0A1N6M5P0_9VIBR|nr:tail fiber assembly protein [Vibrio spartinae]SIO94666.1 hypothetical protein VSP9026_02395 [Vibrio spartinae]